MNAEKRTVYDLGAGTWDITEGGKHKWGDPLLTPTGASQYGIRGAGKECHHIPIEYTLVVLLSQL